MTSNSKKKDSKKSVKTDHADHNALQPSVPNFVPFLTFQDAVYRHITKLILSQDPGYRIHQGERFNEDRFRLQVFAQRISESPLLFSLKSEIFSFNKKMLLERRFRKLLKHHSDPKNAQSKMCAAIVLLLDKIKKAKTTQELEQRVVETGNFTEAFFEKFGMSDQEICKLFATRHGDPKQSCSTTHRRVSALWLATRDELRARVTQEPEQYEALYERYPENLAEEDMINTLSLLSKR